MENEDGTDDEIVMNLGEYFVCGHLSFSHSRKKKKKSAEPFQSLFFRS